MFLWSIFVFAVGLTIGGGFVAALWWVCACAIQDDADLSKLPYVLTGDEVDQQIQKLGDRYCDNKSACLAIVVFQGEHQRFFAFGHLPNGRQPNEFTVFEIASVGKTFTGLLLAEMVERGEVTLATPATALLPPEAGIERIDGQQISLIDLATHASGLPSVPGNMPVTDPLNPYVDYTVPLLYDELRGIALSFAPGRGYSYSNLGYGLLGHLLALKANCEYENLVLDRICLPLGMHNTRMTLTDEQRARIAQPHDGQRSVPIWEDVTMAGAGSFLSTPADMAKYLRAYCGERSGALGAALKLAVKKLRPTDSSPRSIGLAWHIDSENALDIRWHNGGSGGSRCHVAMLPDRQLGVGVFANWAQANVDELGRKLLYLMLRERPEEG